MPAIPSPLSKLTGYTPQIMYEKLIEVCDHYESVFALPINLNNKDLQPQNFFAEDGFHPNSTAYSLLAKKLAKTISELV